MAENTALADGGQKRDPISGLECLLDPDRCDEITEGDDWFVHRVGKTESINLREIEVMAVTPKYVEALCGVSAGKDE